MSRRSKSFLLDEYAAGRLFQMENKPASTSRSFAEARPLSLSEKEVLARNEAEQRRIARLLQVRQVDREKAAERRKAFESTKNETAMQIAKAGRDFFHNDDDVCGEGKSTFAELSLQERRRHTGVPPQKDRSPQQPRATSQEDAVVILHANDAIVLGPDGKFEIERNRNPVQQQHTQAWFALEEETNRLFIENETEEEEERELIAQIKQRLQRAQCLLRADEATIKSATSYLCLPEVIDVKQQALQRQEKEQRRKLAIEYDRKRRVGRNALM